MPPDGQIPAGRAPGIIRPGDHSVRDQNGKVTKFGPFNVISDPKQIMEDMGVVLGIYGRGGGGKTSLFTQLADPRLNPEGNDLPMAILDASAGVKSVAHLVGDNLQDIPLTKFRDLEEFLRYSEATPKAAYPWNSLLLDNVSEFVAKSLAEQGFHGKDGTSSQPDYNVMTTEVGEAVRKLRDLSMTLGINVFFSLWEAPEKTESGLVIGRKADLTPKLSIKVQGVLDWIGYLTVLNDPPRWTRRLTFAPNEAGVEFDGKVRRTPNEAARAIPMELYNPNMVDLLNTIKRGARFPVEKFGKPVRPTGASTTTQHPVTQQPVTTQQPTTNNEEH